MHKSITYIGELARGDVEKIDSFDLAEQLRQDATFFEYQCRTKGISLAVKSDQAQPARISQTGFSMVLLNLWTNAVEALEEKADEEEKRRSPAGFAECAASPSVCKGDSAEAFKKCRRDYCRVMPRASLRTERAGYLLSLRRKALQNAERHQRILHGC